MGTPPEKVDSERSLRPRKAARKNENKQENSTSVYGHLLDCSEWEAELERKINLVVMVCDPELNYPRRF